MKFGLDNSTLQKIQVVFEKYREIEEVLTYGSRAKGNYREGSDIDIALKGEKLTHNLLSSIEQDIDELNTPYLFDISIYHLLKSPSLVGHIERVGKVFYKHKEKV
ncbi:nucleotidyltransferase domain-containing protein [Pleomorphovibrio marinus]|uniref:nucleotidyltransferase domain-containing protein n=1 Tax=Pleomorphovibrio marinus TaxID=2164132 RepID=UPI000E0AB0CC|nr:nucleotidyltransferase domain-containing protein [Pleomorphovibrio marinus]